MIKEAITKFLETREKVYRDDGSQIKTDTNAAESITKDHYGRWFLELFQNSDDANATKVYVIHHENAIYVADNGKGFMPESVNSISRIHFSVKEHNTIGRKGIGFKSIYAISENPQVFTGKEGLEFNKERAKAWLVEKNLLSNKVPYQCLPFFLSREEKEKEDPILERLRQYTTVIKIPLVNYIVIEKILDDLNLDAYSLLAFNNVSNLKIENDLFPYEISVIKGNNQKDIRILRDTRTQKDRIWHVLEKSGKANLPPDEYLALLDEDDRNRIKQDGLKFLVAAPCDETGIICPINDYPDIYVYYKTNEKNPVPIFLHAEFSVTSDRMHIRPSIKEEGFNGWVAERLADLACEFVMQEYKAIKPSAYLRLLNPIKKEERESHDFTKYLWSKIINSAENQIFIPKQNTELSLRIMDSQVLSSDVIQKHKARVILEGLSIKTNLVHAEVDENEQSHNALLNLGIQQINNEGIIALLLENQQSEEIDENWLWTCWEWLAEWIYKVGEDERTRRLDKAKDLKIIPVNGKLLSRNDLEECSITWRSNGGDKEFPEWLPLNFLDASFAIKASRVFESKDSSEPSLERLLRKFSISSPNENTIMEAVVSAIKNYWKKHDSDPSEIIKFIAHQNWHEQEEPLSGIQECPIRAIIEGNNKNEWVKAEEAYFKEEWGNKYLTDLYASIEGIAWVPKQNIEYSNEEQFLLLSWLGVMNCPRILEGKNEKEIIDEKKRIVREIYKIEPRNSGYWGEIKSKLFLDRVNIDNLDELKKIALLALIAANWEYYKEKSIYNIKYRYKGKNPTSIKTFWWMEVSETLIPPQKSLIKAQPLSKCWIPDKRMKRDIAVLLASIDIEKFGENQKIISDWLINEAKIRTNIVQIKIEEWENIISNIIPSIIPESEALDDQKRDTIRKWYASCIDALSERDDLPEGPLHRLPLLCVRAGQYKYIKDEPRWFADREDLRKAFSEHIWMLCELPTKLKERIKNIFGINAISEVTNKKPSRIKVIEEESNKIQNNLEEVKKYIYALIRYKRHDDHEDAKAKVKSLKVYVVDALVVELQFGEIIKEEEGDIFFHEEEGKIYIDKKYSGENYLYEYLSKGIAESQQIEASLIENLLRCHTDEQRMARLCNPQTPGAEVEGYIKEYLSETLVEDIIFPETGRKSTEEKTSRGSSERISPTGSIGDDGSSNAGQGGDTEVTKTKKKPSLKLKEPGKCEVEIIKEIISRDGGGRTGSVGSGIHEHLTEDEKLLIEKKGREHVEFELKKIGYEEVEQMPFENPGYDIKAHKDNIEHRIEVKSHQRMSTVVELTGRQYEEYLECNKHGSIIRWSLWNVENLSEDCNEKVRIFSTDKIPKEILEGRIFSVNLSKL